MGGAGQPQDPSQVPLMSAQNAVAPTELSQGVYFNQPAEFQRPGASLPQILTALGGLGLNIAGAATGKGAAGNAALEASQKFQTDAENNARYDFLRNQEGNKRLGTQDTSKALAKRLGEFDASERPGFQALLQQGSDEANNRVLAALERQAYWRENQTNKRDDELNRLKASATVEAQRLHEQAQTLSGQQTQQQEHNIRVQKFLASMPELPEDSKEGRAQAAKMFLDRWNAGTSKTGAKQLNLSEAQAIVGDAIDYAKEKGGYASASLNPFGHNELPPSSVFAGYAADRTPQDLAAGDDKVRQQVTALTQRRDQIRQALVKAALSPKGSSYDELKQALSQPDQGSPSPKAAPPPRGMVGIIGADGVPRHIPKDKLQQALAIPGTRRSE